MINPLQSSNRKLGIEKKLAISLRQIENLMLDSDSAGLKPYKRIF